MGVTTIIKIVNETKFEQSVTSLQTNVTISVPAHTQIERSMEIPWARDRKEYNETHMLIRAGASTDGSQGITIYHVWQRDTGNDDAVRSSMRTTNPTPDDGWEDPGTRINGESGVNNNRNLHITPNGIFLVKV